MGAAEGIGPRPRFKVGPAVPERMRRVEGVIVPVGAAQQMESDKAGHVAQMRVAGRPHLLEIRLRSGNDLEAVHGNKHGLASGYHSHAPVISLLPLHVLTHLFYDRY